MRTRTFVAGLAATVVSAIVAACGDSTSQPERRLLVLDGIEIRIDEVDPYVAYLDSVVPEGGRKTKVQKVLEDFLIPLRVAQRAFGPERERLRQQAEGLRAVADNLADLETHSTQLQFTSRFKMTRLQLRGRLPMAEFLFDPLRTGSVSQPIEIPQGWVLVAAVGIQEHLAAVEAWVEGYEVAFVTHPWDAWTEWFAEQKQRLATTATFVHPDYRSAMPTWIQLPEQP